MSTLNIVPRPGRGPGRPPGTKNKPTGEAGDILDSTKRMLKLIEHMLTPEQQEYYKRAFSGKEPFDPLKHAEFFMLLASVYTNDILVQAISEKMVAQDIAMTMREYRMGLKDMDDMLRARAKDKEKNDENSRLVDPTRKPELAFLEGVLAETAT